MKKILLKIITQLNNFEALISDKRLRRSPKRNLHNILWERAANQSADFVEKHLEKSLIFYSKKDIWDFVVISLKENFDNGIFIEFGVASEQPLIKII